MPIDTLCKAVRHWRRMAAAGLFLATVAAPLAWAQVDGLVAYYPFDGDMLDYSGNGNHPASAGAVLIADRLGRAASALGTVDGYLEVPDAASLRLASAFTVTLWLRPDEIRDAFSCFVGKDYSTAFALGIDSGGSDVCPAPEAERKLVLKVGKVRGTFAAGPRCDCGTGQWVHLAVTFDDPSDTAVLYVNGSLAATVAHTGHLQVSSTALGSGRDGRYSDRYYGGIDELRLYNRVLSAAEIQAVFAGAAVAPPVGTPATFAWMVPAVAHTAGLVGTSWVTDAVLHNPGTMPTAANLYLLRAGQANGGAVGRRVEIAAGSSRRFADIVAAEFGQTATSGALWVTAEQTLLVSSRTFNNQPDGTFGQLTRGVPAGEALAEGEEGRLVQLAFSPDPARGFRTNIATSAPAPGRADAAG